MKNEFINRRNYIRLDTVFPVEFKLFSSEGVALSAWEEGFTSNVGKGGICLVVNNLKEDYIKIIEVKNAKVSLKINLPFKSSPIDAFTNIAWVRKTKTEPFSQYIIGLEYEVINQVDNKKIIKFAKFKKRFFSMVVLLLIFLSTAVIASGIYNYKQYINNKKLVRRLVNNVNQSSLLKDRIVRINNEKQETEFRITEERGKNVVLLEEINKLQILVEQTDGLRKKEHEAELTTLQKELNMLLLERNKLSERLKRLEDTQEKAEKKLLVLNKEYSPIKENVIDNMYSWLLSHQHSRTGLVASFEGTHELNDCAFVYDQALVAIAYTLREDYDKAKAVFDFFSKTKLVKGAFANGYYISTREVFEYIVHAGPNLWLGIAILQYADKSKDKQFISLAEKIAAWAMALQAEDKDGGLRGGPDVSWYSTEHNLDAYAFFDMLYSITNKDKYLRAKQKILRWIKRYAYDNPQIPVKRGKGDATIATDTYTWSIASIGPEKLVDIGMDPDRIISFAEDNCCVEVDYESSTGQMKKVKGFDFAKAGNIARGGIISCEWTAQMILAYKIMSEYYAKLEDDNNALCYKNKADAFLSELDKMIMCSPSRTGRGCGCLPYASSPFVNTGHGWRTPKQKQTGSLAATSYAFFAYYGFNPLAFDETSFK